MQADNLFGEVIYSYSRRQAIEDGILAQLSGPGYEGDEWVPKMCAEAGFKWPIAMTSAAYNLAVWPIDDEKRAAQLTEQCQDIKGRLWDVLWMLKCAIRYSQTGGTELLFKLKVSRRNVVLKCVTGPGDDGEPVMTIMLPEED